MTQDTFIIRNRFSADSISNLINDLNQFCFVEMTDDSVVIAQAPNEILPELEAHLGKIKIVRVLGYSFIEPN